MKILVISQYYYPEDFQINEICERMVQDGHDVTVLTGLPNYPSGKIPPEYKHGRNREETHNGVKIIRSWEIGRKAGVVGMALNYMSYAVSASIKTLFLKKFDFSFVYQVSPVTMIIPALMLKRVHNTSCITYCCDLWPASIKLLIKDESSLIFRSVKKISKYLYGKVDRIMVQSRSFITYLHEQHNIPLNKINYVPQFADSSYLNLDLTATDNGTVDFVFMGNIGIAQDIENIIDAVEIIKDTKNFKFHFVGNGTFLDRAKTLVIKKGLESKVIFHGRKKYEQLPDLYRLADVCVATLINDSAISSTIPTKVQGYMAAAKPVLAALSGASKGIINDEAQCGICVNPGDSRKLAAAMLDFINMEDNKRKELGRKSAIFFKNNFTKEKFIENLYGNFNDFAS